MLPIQCRMARAGLGLGVRKLAAAAKVSPDTVVRFERGERIRKRTIDSLRQVLEAAGVEFTDGKLKVTGLIFWSLEKARRDRTGLLPRNVLRSSPLILPSAPKTLR